MKDIEAINKFGNAYDTLLMYKDIKAELLSKTLKNNHTLEINFTSNSDGIDQEIIIGGDVYGIIAVKPISLIGECKLHIAEVYNEYMKSYKEIPPNLKRK